MLGLEAPADPVLPHTLRTRWVEAGGAQSYVCGRGLTVLPNLPKPHHVIRDKDRGLSCSTSIPPVSHKAATHRPQRKPRDTTTAPTPVAGSKPLISTPTGQSQTKHTTSHSVFSGAGISRERASCCTNIQNDTVIFTIFLTSLALKWLVLWKLSGIQ